MEYFASILHTGLVVLHLSTAGMLLGGLLLNQFVLGAGEWSPLRLKIARLSQWILLLLLLSGLSLVGFRIMTLGFSPALGGGVSHAVATKLVLMLLLGAVSGLHQRRLKQPKGNETSLKIMGLAMMVLVLMAMVVGVLMPV